MNIIKVPSINGLSKTKGCEKAPDKILDSLKNDFYSNESKKEVSFDSLNIQEIDCDVNNVEESSEEIYKKSLEYFKQNDFNLFLGGDHSISYALGKAFFENCIKKDKKPCLIVFDAHPDLMPVPLGNKNIPTHEEWLRDLIEEGFPIDDVLVIGVRNSDVKENEFIREQGIQCFNINSFITDIEETCDFIMEFAQGKELYVSFDIDVIDPVFAPGTGYREVGGLTSRQGIYLVQRMKNMKNLRAMDLVEINPDKDKDDLTVKLGAKILSELV